jgi:hypothetical protein
VNLAILSRGHQNYGRFQIDPFDINPFTMIWSLARPRISLRGPSSLTRLGLRLSSTSQHSRHPVQHKKLADPADVRALLASEAAFDNDNVTVNPKVPFRVGSEAAKFLSRTGIAMPWALRHVPHMPDFKYGIEVKTSKQYVFNALHLKFIASQEHPLTSMALSRYEEKLKQEPLWWNIDAMAVDTKAFVRRASTKLAKKAFIAALRENGYDELGRRIQPLSASRPGDENITQQSSRTSNRQHQAVLEHSDTGPGLVGTVRFLIKDPKGVANLPAEDLTSYFAKLVKERLEPRLCDRDPELKTYSKSFRPNRR